MNVKYTVRIAAAIGCALTLVGCQSAPPTQVGDQEAGAALAAQAQARVDAAKAPVAGGVPDSSPPVQPDKFVILIPCSQASEGCAQPVKGAEEAAREIGWRTQIIDGKDTASTQNAAIRQAIALKPDGIITFAINPSSVQGALAEARSQGIDVVASSATASDLVAFADNPTPEAWRQSGSLLADYAIAETDGQVKALVLHDTGFDVLVDRHAAFVEQLQSCATCQILDDQTFTFSDLANSVPRLVQQMAQRHPDFNTIYIDYDYAVPTLLQGLRSVNAQNKIVLGSDGTSAAIKLIRDNGGQTATTAFALDWLGWSNIDALNRILADGDPQDAAGAISVKLIDHEVAQDISGLWSGDTDFRSGYRKMWGTES
uniref:substrate-binding domain-containing protein n=1 Tax=Mycolicibacterium obuense TaxID=1807 RepID=UPI003F583CB0